MSKDSEAWEDYQAGSRESLRTGAWLSFGTNSRGHLLRSKDGGKTSQRDRAAERGRDKAAKGKK